LIVDHNALTAKDATLGQIRIWEVQSFFQRRPLWTNGFGPMALDLWLYHRLFDSIK